MKNPLKAHHLKRYKDIGSLLLKYGRSDIVRQLGLEEELKEEATTAGQSDKPDQLVEDLERMGPTFVKLGQLLSSRADLLPGPYLTSLARLQDNVKPFPAEEAERIIQTELGIRLSKAFASFDPEPMAAASLGQVHRATLRDGRPVVVKVQRPGIRSEIAADLEALEEIAGFFDRNTALGQRYQFFRIYEEFRRALIQELDYQREAANLRMLGESLAEFPHLVIPQPIPDYTTRCVLTMDRIQGRKITELDPLTRMEIDGKALAEELFEAYLKQVLLDGQFHADPHPGNIFLTDDGRIALLDLGMMGRLTPGMQESLLKLLLAVSEGDSEEAASIAVKVSERTEAFQEGDFRREVNLLVAAQHNNTLREMQVGNLLVQMSRHAGRLGLLVPTELTLLGKTLLQLEAIGNRLDPEFNPTVCVRHYSIRLLRTKFRASMTPGKLFGSLLEMKEFMSMLPSRLNKILDAIGNAELEVKVRTLDTLLLLEVFQKIANRITTGLVLSALIIGAALLMQVETPFKILGYPGFAILCFVAAAGGGFWLVGSILIKDRKNKKKPPR